jgi:hypothetical protein
MTSRFKPHPITLAVIAALGAGAFVIAPTLARADKARGSYVAGVSTTTPPARTARSRSRSS